MAKEELPQTNSFEIPEDGNDVFQIGKYIFEITESEFSIGEMSHEFYSKISAKLESPQKAIKGQLLNDYDENGEVSFQFACLGIHQNGVPTGEFLLDDDKTSNPYFYLRREGFHYSLSFYGKITFKKGWMAYDGYLRPSYAESPVFPVKINKKFDYKDLNWKEYHFSDLKETENVADEIVQYLKIETVDSDKFPDEILRFKRLKNLSLGNYHDYYSAKHNPLTKIPEGIGELTELQGINIINSSITELPESIGKLKKLETLNISNCKVCHLPESLFQLPNLMYIFADNNQIGLLPEDINLPKLSSISLEKNQLITLPVSLAKLRKLKSLKIDNNPLASLPSAFNQVKGLAMSIKDKRRLLDFEYLGADGKGVLKWNDSFFFAQANDPLLLPVIEILKQNKLVKQQSNLLALAKKTIGFCHLKEENYEKIGNTRFGGMPDLPVGLQYPSFKYDYDNTTYKYEFIAQINCEEIAQFQGYLPRKGMLYFYLSSLHFFGFEEKFKLAQVIYFDGNEALVSGKKLRFINDEYYEMTGHGCYTGYEVTANEIVTFPSFYAYRTNTHIFKGRAEKLLKALETEDKLDASFYDRFENPISELTKTDYEINGSFFTQHESPELQAALSKKGEPQDWVCLLKVSSQGDFQWGDAGDLAFVIHKSDLLKGDFSNIFCTMESS